jgi:hypothetical protein
VKANELAGVSIHSIDLDDFSGSFCDQGPYPFLKYTLSLLMKHPKEPQNVFLSSGSTKKTSGSTSITKASSTKASTAKTTTIISKPVNKKSPSQSSQFKDLKKKDNKIVSKQKSIDKQTVSTTTTKKSDVSSSSKIQNTQSKSSSPSYILITPPKLDDHETLKQWQERLSAKYTQELKNRMTARMSLGQATTTTMTATTLRNKLHQKKQDQFLSQVHAHLPAMKKESEQISNQPVANKPTGIFILPSKTQLIKDHQAMNSQNLKSMNEEKIRNQLDKKQNEEFLLKQQQDNELKRLEEQILRWQLDAKKWIMQLKTHQKQGESTSDVQVDNKG